MKTVWFMALVMVCLGAGVRAGDLVLATYNVENYLATDRMVDGVFRQNYPKPEAEKRALRSVIAATGADVVALQEMGAGPYLEELKRDLAAEGHPYPYAELLEGPDQDRHLAVLSKRPFAAVRKHVDLGFAYFGARESVKRGLLEVRFATEAGEVTLFVVHLKSRLTERDDDPNSALRRQAEAEAVRDRILRSVSDPEKALFLIMGDCNDSAASKALKALQKKGKTALATRLQATDSRGEVWTHYYRKEQTYSAVDHIFVSQSLLPAVDQGAAVVFDGADAAEASDHRPVVVKLKLAPARP